MTSVITPEAFIDYNLKGELRIVEIDGKTWFNKYEKIECLGYLEALAKYSKECGFNIDDGRGYHAFIFPLAEQGLIELI
ncbi:MAG: hypothetical protein UW18_C0020G0013 [Microgenomates group bacterium GW2011_GWF1_44_10]|nr:MAG: hypothetical protein UW18_C0020G0013 [Microgenomates group bacterium GW2011_GWF1_44_10]